MDRSIEKEIESQRMAKQVASEVKRILQEPVCSTCERTRDDKEAGFCSNYFHVDLKRFESKLTGVK